MFTNIDHLETFETTTGFFLKAIAGHNAMLCHVTLAPSSSTPLDNHVQEELGIILGGEFEMIIGSEKKLLKTGDLYLVPPNTVHGGSSKNNGAFMISIFSPPRDIYK